MPNWGEVLLEIQGAAQQNPSSNPFDLVRRKYLKSVHDLTGRNVIAYYSAWLSKPKLSNTSVNDKDKSGFMLTIHRLDKSKGLDLLLHTPGGDIAATESLVDYLYSMFGKDIRVIVPQLAMSAGTMIALSAREIIMGKHSNLGPIDPQYNGIPCQAVIDEFNQAIEDIKKNPQSAILWQSIIGKYHPTFLGSCKQAIEWSDRMVKGWLMSNMCEGDEERAIKILDTFANHKHQKSHSRHISKQECVDAGLEIRELEANQELQDAVLTAHHVYLHTINNTNAVKLIENHNGIAYLEGHNPPNVQMQRHP